MSNTSKAFASGKAFIPFVTCGDPDMETTYRLVMAMIDEGASLVELGIPFSDPTAEGPVIMAASERALKNGTTATDVFKLVERVRKKSDVPLAFMTYANVVFSRGTESFVRRMAQVGADALILPDVPYEEKSEFSAACESAGIDLISLIAPTSAGRAAMIGREAKGFVYCVSSMGVTGERSVITGEVGELIKEIKKVNDIPCAIGFGISGPEQAAEMARLGDGVIIGSAIVKIIAEHGSESVPHVRKFVRSIVNAIGK